MINIKYLNKIKGTFIKDFTDYIVTRNGEIYSVKNKIKQLRICKDNNGYSIVNLRKK